MQQTNGPAHIVGIRNGDHPISKTPETNHGDHHHHHHPHKKNSFKKTLLRLAHSNAYVAIPILALTVESYMYLGSLDFHTAYLGLLFFSTLLLYPLHRLIGIQLTIPVEFTKSQRQVSQHPYIAYGAVILGLLGTGYFSFQLDFFTFQLLIPLGIVSLAYSIPIIPTTQGWKRLRDIPAVKIYAISLVVTFTTSTIPLLLMQTVSISDILLLGIQRFLFILAITIPFDIRDVHLDKRWGLKTIPLLLGNQNAVKLALVLVNVSSGIVVFQWLFTHLFGWEITLAVIVSNLWTSYIITLFRENNSPLFNAFVMEGTMIFHFGLVTLAAISITLF